MYVYRRQIEMDVPAQYNYIGVDMQIRTPSTMDPTWAEMADRAKKNGWSIPKAFLIALIESKGPIDPHAGHLS